MVDLLYHGGPILVIGLNQDGHARYWYWPKDEEIVIPQPTLEQIKPFLKDSLLLCENPITMPLVSSHPRPVRSG